MIPLFFFLTGVWAVFWGLYSITVARNPLRRMVATVAGPLGIILVAGAVTAFLVPGFFS